MRDLMKCEWCESVATRRVKSRGYHGMAYRRFSCPAHHTKTDRLVTIDLGTSSVRETLTNPTGFSLKTGRALGP